MDSREKIRWRVSKKKSSRKSDHLQFLSQILSNHQLSKLQPPPLPTMPVRVPNRLLSRPRQSMRQQQPNITLPMTSKTLQHANPIARPRVPSARKVLISEDERSRLSKAFPKHLEKLQILGKGAAAVIWLAYDTSMQKRVAVKQFLKGENCERERRFVKVMQESEQGPVENSFIGYYYACRLANTDFLVYEVAERSLAKALYDMRGDFYNGERVYRIYITPFYWVFVKDLRRFIRQMASAIQWMGSVNFAHNDLKPQNLLLVGNTVKICDYGSTSEMGNNESKTMITPEYMPPEVLLGFDSKLTDVWSLGIIIVELLNGIPIWMCYKCWLEYEGVNTLGTGLLAVKGKSYEKIISKIRSLKKKLSSAVSFGISVFSRSEQSQLLDLLSGMLELDPQQRLTPKQILSHPFLH